MSWRGWYHDASRNHFGEFFWHDNEDVSPKDFDHGPFETLAEAKKDAIEYFQCDINLSREAIQEIRACKNLGQRSVKPKARNEK